MNEQRLKSVRPLRMAAGIAALAAVAGIAAGQADARPTHRGDTFKRPRLAQGLLQVAGTDGSDAIALRLQAGDPDVLQVDVGDDGTADFSFRRDRIAAIVVDGGAGDDHIRIDDANGAFTTAIPTAIAGGDGNDTLLGGAGSERFFGGAGNDLVDGNSGSDSALLGAGDDTFVWDPGDGSDVIEGQAGTDTMRFNGAGGAEQVDLSANGNRLKFFRVQASITMDTAGVEDVVFNALGGADTVTVNDLAGTDVKSVVVDLANALGGTAGDGQTDRVIVDGTNGDDAVSVTGDSAGVKESGLAAGVELLHAEGASDRLEIDTLPGRDAVDSSGLEKGAIQLFVNGTLAS